MQCSHRLLPILLETTNLRTQGSLIFLEIANTDVNEQKYFHIIYNWTLLVCMIWKKQIVAYENRTRYISADFCVVFCISLFAHLSVYPLAILFSSFWPFTASGHLLHIFKPFLTYILHITFSWIGNICLSFLCNQW